MINNIEAIKSYSPRYIKDFIRNCTIEEKLDTHYISVEIVSSNDVIFKKANGNVIDRVDMILNSMWNKLFVDWNYLRMSNTDWFNKHQGYVITMFFFPCDTPITTKYDSNIRYVFDRVIYNDAELPVKEVISGLHFPETYKIDFKCNQMKREMTENALSDMMISLMTENADSGECFKRLINLESKKYAVNEPEGYIFKYKNKIFQTPVSSKAVSTEKSSYEFLLADFIKYCKASNYASKINQSYIKTVCNLFNDYIINSEKVNHTIEKNITASSIEAPYLGERFEMGYSYIPDQVTKMLCRESKLYENIFKVLLANLSKGKDIKHCLILSRKQVDDWNNITKNIKIHTGYFYK